MLNFEHSMLILKIVFTTHSLVYQHLLIRYWNIEMYTIHNILCLRRWISLHDQYYYFRYFTRGNSTTFMLANFWSCDPSYAFLIKYQLFLASRYKFEKKQLTLRQFFSLNFEFTDQRFMKIITTYISIEQTF